MSAIEPTAASLESVNIILMDQDVQTLTLRNLGCNHVYIIKRSTVGQPNWFVCNHPSHKTSNRGKVIEPHS